VRLSHQPGDVVGSNRTAIEYTQTTARFFVELFGEDAPDERMHLLRLLRRRGATRSDRPNGFVSDYDMFEIRGCQLAQSAFDLPSHDPFGDPGFALGERLADAEDGDEPSR